MAMSKGCQRREHQINYGLDTMGEKEKRTSKKSVDRRSTSSLDNKKFRTRSMEKHKGMASRFQKTMTAVKKPDRQVSHFQILAIGLYFCHQR